MRLFRKYKSFVKKYYIDPPTLWTQRTNGNTKSQNQIGVKVKRVITNTIETFAPLMSLISVGLTS